MRISFVVLFGLVFLFAAPISTMNVRSPGATITVTTIADIVADDGLCALREAIQAANADAPSGTLPGECIAGNGIDTIVLETGEYRIEREGAGDDQNLTGDFDVTSSLALSGENNTTLNGSGLDRVLHIVTGTVTLYHLNIVGGAPPHQIEGAPGPDGGGIYNAGALTLRFVNVAGNRAGDGGRGTLVHDGGRGGAGGGIYTTGPLVVDSSVINNNQSGRGGAALDHSLGSGGGEGGHGGGIFGSGDGGITVANSRITGNHAGNGGRAPICTQPSICAAGHRGGNGGGGGGVLTQTPLEISNTIINDNTAGDGGDGTSFYVRGGHGGPGGGLYVWSSTQATLRDSTIANNAAGNAPDLSASGGNGGGVTGPTSLQNTLVSGNRADDLEGAGADCAGLVTIESPGVTLIETTQGCVVSGDEFQLVVGYDPQLSSTGELLPGSIAIDGGNCPGSATDYLGDPRRADNPFMPDREDRCDIGADELALPLVHVGPVPLHIAEGAQYDLLNLILTERPTAAVTFNFSSERLTVPPVITFSPATWNVPHQVSVAAVNDEDIQFSRVEYVRVAVTSDDPRFDGVAIGDIAVFVRDDDTATQFLPLVSGER